MKQDWFCETCGTIGCVEYDEHADVMTVIHAINDAHNQTSPTCPIEHGIRVFNPEVDNACS